MAIAEVQATLEVENSGGVQCESCKKVKDEAVSLNFSVEALKGLTVMFILCQDCITGAISDAVENDTATEFSTKAD